MRTNQLSLRQQAPPPTRIGGMRGTLLPSVKVARTKSYWPSTPKRPLATGTRSHCQAIRRRGRSRRAGIDGLDEFGVDPVAAGREFRAAQDAGGLPKNEVAVVGVIDFAVETERAIEALEAELGAVGRFDLQVRIADVEGARCVVGAVREQLERRGRALDA